MKVPFFKLTISPAEKRQVKAVLDSGWLTSGEKCAELEKRLSEFTGAPYAVGVSSATDGLRLALKALDIGSGDEVITTGYTFAATISSIISVGARPILVDIERETFNMNPELVAKHISKKTKAIMTVDLAGLPCHYDRLRTLCRRRGLKLICDAAHSLGASHHGKPVGQLGDLTILSFYSTKNLTTGEGGMVLTANKKLSERVRCLSRHGISVSTYSRQQSQSWKYDLSEIGDKANLSELSAALGVARIKRLPALLSARKRAANRYKRALRPYEDYLEIPTDYPQIDRAWHLYIVQLNLSSLRIGRDRFIKELQARGVGCGVHYIPAHRLRAFREKLALTKADFPQSESAYQRVVTLPLYPELTANDIKIVSSAIGEIIEKFSR